MSAINSATSTVPQSQGSGFEALTSSDFLDVIFTELANQDPLAPNDTQQLLQQVGLVRQIESNLQLTESIESILRQNEAASAGGYIGRYVVGRNEAGNTAEGTVASVSITSDGPILNLLSNDRVSLSNVQEVFDPVLLDAIANGGAPPDSSDSASDSTGDSTGDTSDDSQDDSAG